MSYGKYQDRCILIQWSQPWGLRCCDCRYDTMLSKSVVRNSRDYSRGRRVAAFTLIELLVVISIVALLMGVLLPSLAKARQQARAAACQTQVKQWATIVAMYTADNEQKYWVEYTKRMNPAGTWMRALEQLYGDMGKFRVCPSAARPCLLEDPVSGNNNWRRYGSETRVWGPGIPNAYFDEEDFGSYGVNHWINTLEPGDGGWLNAPKLHWKTDMGKGSSDIPILGDCTWYGGQPVNQDNPAYPGFANEWKPPVMRDVWERDPSAAWASSMCRFALDRHHQAINMSFMDGSTRRVRLYELWTLKWHRGAKPNVEVEIQWLPR